MKRPYIILGIIAVLVAVGTVFALNQPKTEEATEPTRQAQNAQENTATNTPSAAPKLIIGDPSAKLAIIEYSDPQCPICKRFFDQTEPQLLKEYIDTGKAYLEVKVETHIGAASQTAGEAWYCAADQGKFKEFHDQTFNRQGREEFTINNLKFIAGKVSLDQTEFDKCLDGGKYATAVQNSHTESKARISSTPTFFIGKQKVVGAQPFSVFRTVIDAELK